jgi:hypothetical protein|tara:strand:+ start:2684 stop:2911 length:228 start_codon:yes stop_codon:yes gene_type:complete
MAISEFTEVVLNIAGEAGDYRAEAKKSSSIPLMQESIEPRAQRSNMQSSSLEERKAMLRKNGVAGVLAMYRGKEV